MMKTPSAAALLAACLWAAPGWAGEGHDHEHGDAAPAKAGEAHAHDHDHDDHAVPAATGEAHAHDHAHEGHAAPPAGLATPRFYALSRNFELVGVIEGTRLVLYLDRAADNVPVTAAELRVEIGGIRLAATQHGAGEYEAELASLPAPGVIPVTATVVVAGGSEVLAGELDLHAEAADGEPLADRWRWAAGLAAAALLAAAGWLARRRLHARKGGGA